MTRTPDLQAGRVRPDGTRPATGTDAVGLLRRGEFGPARRAIARAAPRALSAGEIARVAGVAGRAPSLHNTQPWRLRASGAAVELLADPARRLWQTDPDGREMLISCGAALFGLRLGLRALGYVPAVDVLPAGEQHVVGRVSIAGRASITGHEAELLAATNHRHTHRGPFVPGQVSPRLADALRADAISEGAELITVPDSRQVAWAAEIVRLAAAQQAASAQIEAELRAWTRPPDSRARDGIPAFARFAARGTGPVGGPPPVTAILATAGDEPADWIRAGQALHRILLHGAARWVFAALQSQPLEVPALRAELVRGLALPGNAQMILQVGRSNIAAATPRRPAAEILT